jgi:hypothetical protein
MKKLMLVMGLMAFTVFSYAGEKAIGISKKESIEKYAGKVTPSVKDDIVCTVTQTAKATVYFVEYTVTCSSSQPTCKQAIEESANCVTEALKRIKSVLIQH